ncbi:MAG TPA: alcohol dehydrogenase catalytic domain-containing protein, partial [Mycobacterium sp.]|nr:alcohol dehydrogenase catalytic domain-containing protein [Mycobacterium sp.]
MRTARLHRAHDIRLHDEPDPIPNQDEALVRVLAVGLCGSDRHWFMEGGIGDAVLRRPLVLGHEICGLIEAGARRGERVAVDPSVPCGRCELCRTDLAHVCADAVFAGHSETDGGLRTLMTWPQRQLVPIPDSMTAVGAALLEPLAVAIHAADLGRVEAGMSAGVFGCGPIGLLLIAVLRSRGVSRI